MKFKFSTISTMQSHGPTKKYNLAPVRYLKKTNGHVVRAMMIRRPVALAVEDFSNLADLADAEGNQPKANG